MDKQLNLPLTPPIQLSIDDLQSSIHLDFTKNIIRLQKKKVIFNIKRTSSEPIGGWDPKPFNLPIRNLPEPRSKVQLVGLDSTCIPIAATEEGTVFASRATVVFNDRGASYSYLRLGPLLLYLDQSTVRMVLESLHHPFNPSRLPPGDRALAQRLVRVRLERAIGLKLAQGLHEGMLLIDGSLRTSIFDSPECGLDKILKAAENVDLAIIGVCKSSTISVLNGVMGWLLKSDRPPVYADVHELVSPLIHGLRGRVFLARFTNDGPTLRVDVWSGSSYTPEEALSAFRFSDLFTGGYPESLRLAHHLSVFTPVEVACIKSHLSKNLEAEELPTEDRRSTILGRLHFLRFK